MDLTRFLKGKGLLHKVWITVPAVCLMLVATVSGTHAQAKSPASFLESFTFAGVPKGYRLTHIAWETTPSNGTMNTTFPQGIPIVSPAAARKGVYIGPLVAPGGKLWYLGETLGARGQVVWEFTGLDGAELCATSLPLNVPHTGSWHLVRIPMLLGAKHRITLAHYHWFHSKDGRWTMQAPKIIASSTPNQTGYSIAFSYLPLDWQLQAFRYVSGRRVLGASVAQAVGQRASSPFFSESSLGWSFSYPTLAASWKGRLEAAFSDGHGHLTWLGMPLTLRG